MDRFYGLPWGEALSQTMGLSLGAHYYGLFRDQQVILLSLALFKQSMFVFAMLLGKGVGKGSPVSS